MMYLGLKRPTALCLPAFLLLFVSSVFAEGPTAQIKSAVDRVIEILINPALREGVGKGERYRLLRETILPRFDFREIAKRSLGAHWRRRTPEEREEFVKIFTDLLENAYLGRIESYNNERFLYTGEKIEKDYAEVASKIVTSGGEEYKINYRLRRTRGEWKIYDVVVEDVSLVNNYRSQFHRVITRSSYEELVSRMKQKLSKVAPE